jgi:hypothetical protein
MLQLCCVNRMYHRGVLVASAAQEGLIRVTPKYQHPTPYNVMGETIILPTINRKTTIVQTAPASGSTPATGQQLTYGNPAAPLSSQVVITPVTNAAMSVPRHIPIHSRL